MQFKMAETRKYTLAGRANWIRRAWGMNVTQLYFRVLILFFLKKDVAFGDDLCYNCI